MKVLYLGRKPAAGEGLEYLVSKGVDVTAVVLPSLEENQQNPLVSVAKKQGIPVLDNEKLYSTITETDAQEIDLVISFLYNKKIKEPLISSPKLGCINFHPAPLPEYRGFGIYSLGIYENAKEWGVSAHFVDKEFDTGDIIKVSRFEINPEQETAYSLEQKSQDKLLELFKEIMDKLLSGEALPRIPQKPGKYFSKKDFETLRKVNASDTEDEINRKIRAFWYPPYPGAYTEINNKEYTLVNQQVLDEAAKKYSGTEVDNV